MSAYDTGYRFGQLLAPLVCCGFLVATIGLTAGLIVWQVRHGRSS